MELRCGLVESLFVAMHTHIAEPSVPHTLLENILQSELPADIYVANVSGLDPTPTLQSSLHDLLSQQLQV